MNDDDKPRRSWRDLDRKRDQSSHRRDEPGGRATPRQQRSQRSYRARLDRLFDSGRLGQLVDEPSSPEGGAARLKLLEGIRSAEGRDAITRAVDAYRVEHDVPEDVEILSKAIEHKDEAIRREMLERLLSAVTQHPPRRTRGLIGQLKLIKEMADEDQTADLAGKVIDQLDA